jgi:integrase
MIGSIGTQLRLSVTEKQRLWSGRKRLEPWIPKVSEYGTPATHPLSGREMRELRAAISGKCAITVRVVSESGAPLSAPGFSRIIKRAATAANLGINAHAHMLRHACGYNLANDGHDTRAIQAVSRPPQHSKHDTLYRLRAAAVQGILSRLNGCQSVK